MGGKAGSGWSWGGLEKTFTDPYKHYSGISAGKKYIDDQKGHRQDLENDAKREQQKLQDDLAAQKEAEQTQAENAGLRRRQRLSRSSRRSSFGRGTILTSPIGVIGDAQTSGKTLLGQ